MTLVDTTDGAHPPGRPPAATSLPVQIRRNLAAEWTKQRSVRSSIASMVAVVLVCVGLAVMLSSYAVNNWDAMSAKQHNDFHPATSTVSGVFFGQLVIGALGVLAMSSEYSTGTIRATLTASPQRLQVYLAKITVFTSTAFVLTLATMTTAFGAGQAILSRKHLGVSLFDPGVPRIVVGSALFLVAVGLLGLGLATLLRHTAAAISTLFALMLVLTLLANFLPAHWQDHVDKWLPLNAGTSITQTVAQPDQLAPWTGLALIYGYALIALIAGGIVLQRRDA